MRGNVGARTELERHETPPAQRGTRHVQQLPPGLLGLTRIFIMPTHSNGLTIMFYRCCFLFLPLSLFLFSSPILSDRRLDVYRTTTHDVVLVRL